jgi:hypothetical protein
MIRRHYFVEIKRVKELPLSTLSPPHHGPLPRITSQSDGITVRPWSQREFCNTFGGKADKVQVGRDVRSRPKANTSAFFQAQFASPDADIRRLCPRRRAIL